MSNKVRAVRKNRDITLEELSDRTGISTSYLSRIEAGSRRLTLENAVKVARALDCEVVDISDDFAAADFAQVENLEAISPSRKSRGDQHRIPDLAIHGGMGNGGFLSVKLNDAGDYQDPEDVRGFWTFPDYMLRQLVNLKSIYAWEARGDSMEPTLPGGSVVFVDTSQTALPPEDIYALNYGDGLMVKRLKLVPRTDQIDVISDNERYGTDRLLRDDVQIYGRVVGWFQWRG